MKKWKRSIFPLLTALALLFSACEKNGPTESQSDPEKAADLVSQANQILVSHIELIANAEGPDTAALNLSSAASLYEQALTYDPENLDAHFGLALSEVLTAFSDPSLASLLSGSNQIVGPGSVLSLFKQQQGVAEFFGSLDGGARSRLSGVLQPGALLKSSQAEFPQADNPPSYYQDIVESKLLPVIADAVGHLATVTGDASYAFLITPQMLNGATTETYRIDLTEIYLFEAVLQGIGASFSAAVAYNIDYDDSSPNAVETAWSVSSPFLTLRTGGAQHMKDTRTYMLGMMSSVRNGINFLMAEPAHQETDIIRYNPQDQASLQSVIMVTDSLTAVLSGPCSIQGGPTVNFVNFYDNAITNYKAKFPNYTVGSQARGTGAYNAVITWEANSFDTWVFPDPTMNGLFPGMTDAGLKDALGLTAQDWQKTFVIGD